MLAYIPVVPAASILDVNSRQDSYSVPGFCVCFCLSFSPVYKEQPSTICSPWNVTSSACRLWMLLLLLLMAAVHGRTFQVPWPKEKHCCCCCCCSCRPVKQTNKQAGREAGRQARNLAVILIIMRSAARAVRECNACARSRDKEALLFLGGVKRVPAAFAHSLEVIPASQLATIKKELVVVSTRKHSTAWPGLACHEERKEGRLLGGGPFVHPKYS